MEADRLDLTREWHWGIAIVGDPTGEIPDLDPSALATVGDTTVVLLLHHMWDVGLDDDPASSTVHVRVLHAEKPHERTVVCDTELNTPSSEVSIGDADEEVRVAVPSTRTRLVASAEVVRDEGLDEVWIDLIAM